MEKTPTSLKIIAMLKRLAFVSLTIYIVLVFASSAKAKPLSCAGYAVTNPEKQLVEVLQAINAVKTKMVTIDKQLKNLRSQMDGEYDSSRSESVNAYNLLINDFNNLVLQKNQLSDKHNSLKNSFNSLIKVTSPSKNTSFVLCMNSEVVATDASTVMNAENLDQQIEELNQQTDNLDKQTEHLDQQIEELNQQTDNLDKQTEHLN